MAREPSILKSVKKILGGAEGDPAFDLDVTTHINSAFFSLYQLGIGPPDGFEIEDEAEEWEDFTGGEIALNPVKTYIYLKVKSWFDPPGTPHHITAMNDQLTELEHRLKMERELAKWTAPSGPPGLETDPVTGGIVLQGGDLDG